MKIGDKIRLIKDLPGVGTAPEGLLKGAEGEITRLWIEANGVLLRSWEVKFQHCKVYIYEDEMEVVPDVGKGGE